MGVLNQNRKWTYDVILRRVQIFASSTTSQMALPFNTPASHFVLEFVTVCTHIAECHFCYWGVMLCVLELVKALRYKPEGRGFDSPMVSFEFSIGIIRPAALWPRDRLSLLQK